MFKSKIHRAVLTATDLAYEGSITIDATLLRAADILPGEQVHVLNLNNGSRIVTYAIEGEADSGTMMLNGPAARAGIPGDIIVIITYCNVDDADCKNFTPNVVKVDKNNRLVR
ncbi:MAG: aspartate 1-decarboxylase [Planctomycetaceae bacterium]|jgi:aspartate 1-decarboxylase|nr:aspartate 1-decarboxylase [Planctomycetaceae bacterium]